MPCASSCNEEAVFLRKQLLEHRRERAAAPGPAVVSVAIGQQNIACRLYVPANDKIFALGSYVVQCKIESN